jgi:uncharacterized protein YdiU (UPF0061 family)
VEAYDPETVFSSIDVWGRYAFGNQPVIAGWNLARFAETLLPLFSDNTEEGIALAEESFGVFRTEYDAVWWSGMRAKLGLPEAVETAVLTPLVDDLLVLLKESRVDYTSFFRRLSAEPKGLSCDVTGFDEWAARWRALGPDTGLMDRTNPIYIPRNALVEEVLTAATAGDLDPLSRLLDAVSAPFDQRPGLERYAEPAPEDFGNYRTFCGT